MLAVRFFKLEIMWKNIKNDKPKKQGFVKVFGLVNKGTEHQTKTKYDAFWNGSEFTDKQGEDLIGINEGVIFWFDFDEVENPIEIELNNCNHKNIQLKSSGIWKCKCGYTHY